MINIKNILQVLNCNIICWNEIVNWERERENEKERYFISKTKNYEWMIMKIKIYLYVLTLNYCNFFALFRLIFSFSIQYKKKDRTQWYKSYISCFLMYIIMILIVITCWKTLIQNNIRIFNHYIINYNNKDNKNNKCFVIIFSDFEL